MFEVHKKQKNGNEQPGTDLNYDGDSMDPKICTDYPIQNENNQSAEHGKRNMDYKRPNWYNPETYQRISLYDQNKHVRNESRDRRTCRFVAGNQQIV